MLIDDYIYNHSLFVAGKARWIMPFSKGGRWECNYIKSGFARLPGDLWKMFIR